MRKIIATPVRIRKPRYYTIDQLSVSRSTRGTDIELTFTAEPIDRAESTERFPTVYTFSRAEIVKLYDTLMDVERMLKK